MWICINTASDEHQLCRADNDSGAVKFRKVSQSKSLGVQCFLPASCLSMPVHSQVVSMQISYCRGSRIMHLRAQWCCLLVLSIL